MDYADCKPGMRVRYTGTTSSQLVGRLGTIDTGLECHSGNCVGVLWDEYKAFGVYPHNIEKYVAKGRNKL